MQFQVGDLVNFYSSFASWQRDYRDRNPGLVINKKMPCEQNKFDKGSAEILWSNGDISNEHSTYLKLVSVSAFKK
tara:strand:+ start:353 stop:577 length:225 start_codon:yes stop_codon:yes gene_type:complete